MNKYIQGIDYSVDVASGSYGIANIQSILGIILFKRKREYEEGCFFAAFCMFVYSYGKLCANLFIQRNCLFGQKRRIC